MSLPRVLVIAGSDSGGGAGLQADLKAVAVLGGHAMTVVTALTAQNTREVRAVHPVPVDFVEAQFRAVVEDMGVDAVKTGMLASAELVERVARLLEEVSVPVVVDPVMVAKGGARLLAEEAVEALRRHLLPRATLLTPNLPEAEVLTGRPVRNHQDMVAAARRLVEMGAKAVLVKGGHLADDPCDVLYDGRSLQEFRAPRIEVPHTHGTGCTLASACATLLAQGWELPQAVGRARELVRRAIAGGLALGKGVGPVHAMAYLAPAMNLADCLREMYAALSRLESVPGLGHLIPEVRGQMAYALPGATSPREVLAVAGRITEIGGYLRAAGPVMPGASRHMAKVVLAAMAFDPTRRAVMALRFDERLVGRARDLGWTVGEFSRGQEPAEIKSREGSTLEWGTREVVRRLGRVPRAIFDRGEVGKEPVLRLIAANPAELVDMVLALANRGEKVEQKQ